MSLNSTIPAVGGQEPGDADAIFVLWRTESLSAGLVVSGRLLPELTPESPAVQDFLARWPGSFASRRGAQGWELLLFQPSSRRERWWLHSVLLLATLFSTFVAGSLLAGRTPIFFRALALFDGWWIPIPIALDAGALLAGVPFGLALVGLLALHEAGHYFTARHHRISVTPPFFVPFPPYLSIIGTLGAFIRLRSPVISRRTLLDVAVAGPLVSFLASLPLLYWGLLHSRVVAVVHALPGSYLLHFAGERFWLGGSLALSGLARLVLGFSAADQVLVLHPIAFAGWLGLFVTALNLLPISQLDGGHILYAAFGSHQRPLAWLFFLALIPLGLLWAGWWVWAVLVYVVGRGRIEHPPLFDAERGLTRGRGALSLVAGVVFLLCFVPVPFRF
ncbi:MAG: site-2 protease family protein [Gemmatimonadota bacterium]|nr:MAG: site-2 protease family protein [Gemmatimonadota bacterium]